MSFDDKKFGALFPTRTGTPTGTTNERKMLDKMGGSEGFRKSFQTNLDGSVTQCNTRNGMPEFITRGEIPPVQPKNSYYMESGQLEWSFPGDENPTRLDPAKWHFLDIPTTSDYLGKIAGLPPVFGAQTNTPELTEGMESQAIGYPYQSDPAKVAAIKEAYGNATLMKKLTAAFFPASLFSGKMRAFIQAQYGAKETQAGDPLHVEVFGGSVNLLYKATIGGVTASVQFGLWSHASPGIFNAGDGSYWLLNITGGPAFTVTAYQIKQITTVAKELLKEHTLNPSDEAESYLFAHSTIDTTNPQVVGTFTGAAGAAMAYGWKWNSDGSKASIVVHEGLGSGVADLRWQASTMHMSVSYTAQSPVSAAGLYVSCETVGHGEWTDGWGTWNIFVPSAATSTAPLDLYSLATNTTGVKPAFNFSGIPVYGYYKGSEWQEVVISRNLAAGARNTQRDANIIYNPDLDMGTYIPNRDQYGAVFANQGCSYEQHEITSSTTMPISVGGISYAGGTSFGTHVYKVKTVASAGEMDNTVSFTGTRVGGGASFGDPPGYVYSDGTGSNGGGFCTIARCTITVTTFVGTTYDAWALVIPGGDCAAAYVATHTSVTSASYTTSTRVSHGVFEFHGAEYRFAPYANVNAYKCNGWFGVSDPDDTLVITPAPPAELATKVFCFNTAVDGDVGIPGGSYYALFNVNKNYPYYDRGMYVYTSAGKRYVGSEGIKSPESVNYLHRFVGWA